MSKEQMYLKALWMKIYPISGVILQPILDRITTEIGIDKTKHYYVVDMYKKDFIGETNQPEVYIESNDLCILSLDVDMFALFESLLQQKSTEWLKYMMKKADLS